MIKLLLSLIFFTSLNALSNVSSTKKIQAFNLVGIAESDTPYIIKLMLDHLKETPIPRNTEKKILKNLVKINDNFVNINKVNKTFLVTSESYKSILNFKSGLTSKSGSVMISELEVVRKKLKKFKLIYTDFSQYIISKSLDDFNPYLEDNFLDQYQSNSNGNSKKLIKIAQLKKIIKYSGPWIHAISSSPAKTFNEQLVELISNFFRNLAEQSYIFTLHKSEQLEAISKPPFTGLNNIQILNIISGKSEQIPDPTSSDIRKSAKADAINEVKKLKLSVPANPSQDIDELIQKIDQ